MRKVICAAWAALLCGVFAAPLAAAEDSRLFIDQSLAGAIEQRKIHSATWGFDNAERWDVDQDAGEIKFIFANGKVGRAPVQIIGTFNTKDGSFLWAWDHPSVLEPLRAHAKLAKAWGEKHKLAKWTARKVQVSDAEAWEFAAVAARLGKANGAYRAAGAGPIVFVTFGEIVLEKKKR